MLKNYAFHLVLVLAFGLFGLACDSGNPNNTGDADTDSETDTDADIDDYDRPPPPKHDGIYSFANACYAMDAAEPGANEGLFLEVSDSGAAFSFTAPDEESAERFYMKPSDLGTYLFYDTEEHYFIVDESDTGELTLSRTDELVSDILLLDDEYVSPAEWELQESTFDTRRFRLRNLRTQQFLTVTGLTENEAEAAVITLYPQTGCAEFPELTIDATGTVEPRQWEDGDVFGFVETHSHMFTNFAFGGGGIFHGSPFHRLGVEHALPSCEPFHGAEGRQDLVGYLYDSGGLNLDTDTLLSIIKLGGTPDFNHHTDGYPEFTDWPNAWASSTHQTMYYRWIERAYLSGMRLIVNHATGNSVLCEIVTGLDLQEVRYSCNDMLSVNRTLQETYNLERYIDAQHGGPGEGWFRIVTSPAEARQVINEGKLAVVLGIEISNVFDCFLTPREDYEECNADWVRDQLDTYYDLGVRPVFPVHKYDNAFTAGDGHSGVIELGNFINSGHYSNFTQDCPDISSTFDRGPVTFGGLNHPRDDYLAPAPFDMSGFERSPLVTLLPHIAKLEGPSLEGDWCQNAGLTSLGETLIHELMLRGMIIEIAHLPRFSAVRAYELFVEADYPAASTHGNPHDGMIYTIGGVANSGFGRCGASDRDGAMVERFRDRIQLIIDNGGYPAEGFSFDFNGFAGAPRPRFGDDSPCGTEQSNPITYPFQSYDGNITFEQPNLGNRTVDFNTEGMIHFGLLPELIEDVRRDGATDEDLEPLFRSAEGYIRMWELAEERAAELQ